LSFRLHLDGCFIDLHLGHFPITCSSESKVLSNIISREN
jgi:hypothetical protein